MADGTVLPSIETDGDSTTFPTNGSASVKSKSTNSKSASDGQQLTHYHSFFSSLLSWDHPRATAITYASIVLFIFAARYLNILRYAFKVTYMTLGITVITEATGKALFSHGFISQIRPRKYYTIPKETLDGMLSDVHELINFFVIESQRILFAENILASAAAFLGAFISYFLIKVVPIWGLCLLSTTIIFFAPLIYKTNQELIDSQVATISDLVNQQTEQVKQIASHHAAIAADTTKAYAADYTAMAQEMISNARGRSTSPALAKSAPAKEATTAIKSEDFPEAPKDDFEASPAKIPESEPLIAA